MSCVKSAAAAPHIYALHVSNHARFVFLVLPRSNLEPFGQCEYVTEPHLITAPRPWDPWNPPIRAALTWAIRHYFVKSSMNLVDRLLRLQVLTYSIHTDFVRIFGTIEILQDNLPPTRRAVGWRYLMQEIDPVPADTSTAMRFGRSRLGKQPWTKNTSGLRKLRRLYQKRYKSPAHIFWTVR